MIFENKIDISTLYNSINEKLTDVDSDVNMIYDKYFKSGIDAVQNGEKITYNLFPYSETDTSILQCEDSIKSNELNKCKIIINFKGLTNYYRPKEHVIHLGINPNAMYLIDDFNGVFEDAVNYLDFNKKKSFVSEFSEHKIKGTIHHELAHWIDDTLHNKHITNRIDKMIKYNTRDLNNIPIDMTHMEIQGQIHNIKQAYNKYKIRWDTLSFSDLLDLIPSLKTIYNNLASKGNVSEWKKILKHRMYREGLLGKNMIN